ncbi:response regulator [Marinomonas shanghaiensis]|uniref:response regulator n=1 Tax=Marinomonas shanghaiensis TaxID=2202418 RepID=UPI003A9280A2
MKILIVEDDQFKCQRVEEFFRINYEKIDFNIAENLVDAIESIRNNSFDLIIVDMAIPSHPLVKGGGAPTSLLSGGVQVLLKLSFMKRKDPCIVLTQFHDMKISGQYYDLDKATHVLNENLKCNVLSCIEYKDGDDAWENELERSLGNI